MRLSVKCWISDRCRQILLQPLLGFTILLLSLVWFGLWHHLDTQRQSLERQVASDTSNLALAFAGKCSAHGERDRPPAEVHAAKLRARRLQRRMAAPCQG